MGRADRFFLALPGGVLMATFALQAVGTYFGGPIGGAVGAIVGGMIDQALFGPGDQEGPRLSDLRVTTASYGVPIPLIYGPENRVSGSIIWASELIETSEEQGGKGGGPSFTQYSYRVSCALLFSGREVTNLKRIWANNKVIYDADAVLAFSPNHPLPTVDPVNGQVVTRYFLDETGSPEVSVSRGTHSVFDELHFYPGNGTQVADPLMESFEGAGNVPPYRHTSYVVLKDLQLADFGNRIPNFEFEVEADSSITVASAVKDITERGGILNASVFGLSDNLRGYVVGRQSPIYTAILPLEVAFGFETTEARGQIRYVKRGLAMKGTVPIEVMNAQVPKTGTSGKNPIDYTNETEIIMPDSVSISYKDPAMDYQINTQSANRRKGNAINKIAQELPIVLDADNARRVADRLLWGVWANKRSTQFKLSDTWARLNPGDLVGVPVFGEILPMRIVRTTRGNNGIIELTPVYEDLEVYKSQSDGIAGPASNVTVSIPGVTRLMLMDAPLLQDEDPAGGFYWAASGESDGWRGVSVKRSTDEGVTYATMADTAIKTPIGEVTGTLPDGPTPIFDTSSTLTVTLTTTNNTLESISELLVLNGGNAAWVGPENGGVGEIIQFKTATLIAPGTYELTDLLRGRLGTEHATATHTSGEFFVLLKSGLLRSNDFGTNDWNKPRSFKPVTVLADEDLTTDQPFTNTGIRSKPLAPVHVLGVRDGSNDLTITWVRRTRLRTPGLGNGPAPLGEATESYEIDIFDGATVVRTITASAQTLSYTAAEQTTDGLTPGDPVICDIYQLSETKGRGYAARATI